MTKFTLKTVRRRHTVLAVLVGAVVALGLLVAPGANADPLSGSDTDTTAKTEHITIGTFNTLRGAATIKPFADVIGWQEVNDKPDRDKLKRSLPGYQTYWPKSDAAKAIPISWNSDRFSLVQKNSIRTHKGESKVTPARYVNWVLLKDRKTGEQFVFINTHFISGAFTGHPERQKRWRQHADVLRRTVRNVQSSYPGAPVFVVGDFNRKTGMDLKNLVQLPDSKSAAHPGYDQVYASGSVSTGKAWVKPKWGSDHNARKAFASW